MSEAGTQRLVYEYRVEDTPKFSQVEDEWELVDVLPKFRNGATIYLVVFRRPLHGLEPNTPARPDDMYDVLMGREKPIPVQSYKDMRAS
jgi:hypothetical protein